MLKYKISILILLFLYIITALYFGKKFYFLNKDLSDLKNKVNKQSITIENNKEINEILSDELDKLNEIIESETN